MRVKITIGNWSGTIGTLEDKIPHSDWWNVSVSPDLRLALTEAEFIRLN